MSHGTAEPSAWVRRFAALVRPGARVLDVACGRGRHARYLASRGLRVQAVDRDAEALAALAGVPGVSTLQADLEGAPWPFADGGFGAVVVTNYLHRPLFPALLRALAPGAVLIYETFASGQERFGRPSSPAFLLQPGELLGRVAGLHVVAYEDLLTPAPARVQRICALAPEEALERWDPPRWAGLAGSP